MKRFFSKKPVKIILCLTAAVLIAAGACNAVFAYVASQKQTGTASCTPWSQEDVFRMEDTRQIDMGTDDFKILCLTDVHLRNHATFGAPFGVNIVLDAAGRVQIRKLIEREQPDLIVVTGDTVLTQWNDIMLQDFSDFMDTFEIPWAHVFGNHDAEGRADKAKLSEILQNSKYGLFQCGPDGMNGMGNYIVNLQRGDKTAYSLFLFDDGEYRTAQDGTHSDGGISTRQISWYEWALNGIEQANGASVPSMAFLHVPLPEYKEIEGGYLAGQRGEDSFTAKENNGFFDVFKSRGGTHVFAGHDHSNNFLSDYEGVALNYVTKSSYNCYFSSKALGGTLITLKADHRVTVENKSF